MSDSELGAFLRTRRESITPAEVGLPSGPRRRTPGLRRSELAMLAGVSVEYLTRLEQGRDRNPSPEVLAALAGALHLSHDEHVLLHRSAKLAGGALCPTSEPPADSVRPTVRMLLDHLEPTPALLRNRVSDVIAYTSGFERLARPFGLLDAQPPNLLRFVFTDARARTVFPDWERVADEHAAMLRAETHCGDFHSTGFVEEVAVTAGATLAERLRRPPEPPSRTGVQRVAHPEVGVMRLAYETLDLADAEQRLVVFLAADEGTSATLDRLTGRRPGALHAVGS
ncbi:helix-turn-helix domain-containing protein [Halostreptopolyspora alba]|uniref:XRE family transcriptional regulator n=1 Tax=Halostreptopolyspora alba TaxID=2487137 RepID=A0A3N0EDA3_9ACTN|nr:XRE family transcriptional regulator [Nocardiopsaceae bacterium YIM 96095]